jgi:hypothetical protein
MDNISSMIGALELGDNLESHDDGALEATRCCPISDGALEMAGGSMALAPTSIAICGTPTAFAPCR